MTDFAENLIKNLGLHATPRLSSPVKLTDKLGQLGETLRYARTSLSLASLSQALTGTSSTTTTTTTAAAQAPPADQSITPPAPERAIGRLWINVAEARNLSVSDPLRSNVYCLVQYDKNVFSTLDKHDTDDDSENAGPTQSIPIPNAARKQNLDVFQLAMEASSPKWRYNATFDVCNEDRELVVSVFDQGNPLPNGDDRFLGLVKLKPSLVPKKTTDQWCRLLPRTEDEKVTGEIRLQTEYTSVGPAKLTPESFRIVRLLGHGSFGKVYQVIKRDTKRTYAMKVLSKQLLISQNEVAHTLSERNVLVHTLSNPFIVTLKFSFQTADHLFLVMDYIPGGELFTYLQKEQYFDEARARFYIAELVLALEHIHAHQVVYRDLKPENILLDAQGHVALTDFGLCKELKRDNDTTSTFCGTSEYLAPEMVRQEPYTKTVDWWALGILLYEILTGGPPFHSVHLDVLYRKICKAPLKFPSHPPLSPEAKDLICRLLDRNPETRLGAKHDAQEIKEHEFFKDVQWDSLAQKQTRPPFKPALKNQKQQQQQQSQFQHLPSPMLKQHPSFLAVRKTITASPLSSSTQSAFKNFSYVRDDTASIASSRRTVASFLSDEDEDDLW